MCGNFELFFNKVFVTSAVAYYMQSHKGAQNHDREMASYSFLRVQLGVSNKFVTKYAT